MTLNVTWEEFSHLHRLNRDCQRGPSDCDETRWIDGVRALLGDETTDALIGANARVKAHDSLDGVPRIER